MNARIIDVEDEQLGSVLAADAAAGATTIEVADPTDFDDSGQLQIGSETPTYSAVDEDTGVITLDAPLVSAYLADDGVDVTLYPAAYVRYATLVGADDLEDEEGMKARVPLALYDKLPIGVRDLSAGEGETCQAAFFGDELVLTDITGELPLVDGSFIDPTTLPPAGTDGNPPTSSPAAEVIGTIGGLFVHWSAVVNGDPVTYEVHISTTSGFTPSASTKAAETGATAVTLHQLPDGSSLAYFETDGVTPQVYYVQLVAKDADGSAAAGAEGSGTPVQVTGPDIAAASITGDRIVGNSITADQIVSVLELAGTVETAESGQRIVIDSTTGFSLFAPDESTLVQFPTDPDKDAQFNGQVDAAALAVSGLAQFADEAQVLPNAELRLIGGQPDPSLAPVVSAGYTKVFDFNYNVDGNQVTGSRITHYSANGGAGGTTPCYYGTLDTVAGGGTHRVYAVEWLASNGSINRKVRIGQGAESTTGNPMPVGFGACLIGSTVVASHIEAGTGSLVLDVIELGNFLVDFFITTALQPGNANLDPDSNHTLGFGCDGTNPYFFSYNGTTKLPNKIACTMVGGAPNGAMTVTSFGAGAVKLNTPGDANNLGDSGGPTNVIGAAWDGTRWYVNFSWSDSGGTLTGRLLQMYDGSTGAVVADQEIYLPFSAGFFGGGITFDGTDYYLAGGSATTTNRRLKGSTALLWDHTLGAVLYVGYTWDDGTHHTGLSPVAQVSLDSGIAAAPLQRSTVIVTLPGIPALASKNPLYALFGSSTPAAASMKLQSAPTHASTDTASPVEFLTWNPSGAAPAASTFAFGGSPAALVGDGSGVSASWELDSSGVMRLPVATPTQRDAVAVTKGDLVFNDVTKTVDVFDGNIHKALTPGLVQQVLSIPSTAGGASGTLTVTISGLNVGDVVIWAGLSSSSAFTFNTDPVCTVADQITLRYHNVDDATAHALATQTHTFLVFRRS